MVEAIFLADIYRWRRVENWNSEVSRRERRRRNHGNGRLLEGSALNGFEVLQGPRTWRNHFSFGIIPETS
ncbi:unnamed protein product [Coffea canephora]|uniref:Uncharacterized protein n=1 Tax=Coffea canephora TaxID=49390 RepID=A0A068UJ47_COFCA|nr:unnamed protein product [Coffea canephora]